MKMTFVRTHVKHLSTNACHVMGNKVDCIAKSLLVCLEIFNLLQHYIYSDSV